MRVHLLGTVRVVDHDGNERSLASASQRRLLSLLALRAGDAVSLDALSGAFDASVGMLRTTISRLRRLLGPGVLATVANGYRLDAPTDLQRFDDLVAEARRVEGPMSLELRREALAMSASGLLTEFAHESWAHGACARVDEARASLVEDQADDLIALGQLVEAMEILHVHLAVNPFRDRACGLLMTALALGGRQVEAHRLFDEYRRRLGDETGLEPSAGLRDLERRIAADELQLAAERPVLRPIPTVPTGTVTLLLTDIESSSEHWARDIDAMSAAVSRHDALIDAHCDAHGGVRPEQQGEGDSAVVAFASAGDALAAAVDLQRAFTREHWATSTPIRVRIGLHTGEAMLRDANNYEGPLIITAARLRDLGHGGQILVSESVKEVVAGTGLHDDVSLAELGERRLRGIEAGVRVFQVEAPDLLDQFPPLRSPTQTPNNIEPKLSTFVGRAAEVATLTGLVDEHRLVTVLGTGGAGKTRLAHRVASDRLELPSDGVWWVELGALSDPSDVTAAIAAAMSARALPDESDTDAAVRRIGDARSLVVLDNAEHLLEAVAAITSTLLAKCPQLSVLITSRRRLGVPGEFAWRIPPLASASDAITLFRERAVAVGDTDDEAVAAVCGRLGGVPLAIELAAARTRSMTPSQIAAGLDDALPLLSRGPRGAPPRHQTVEASIAWSVDLLDDRERSMLEQLTVFAGSFDLAAASSICGFDGSTTPLPLDVVDVVEDLLDHSLVSPAGAVDARRFQLLETVRQFIDRRRRDSQRHDDLRERHAIYFAELAMRLGPSSETFEEAAAVSGLEADADNLRAALTYWRDGRRVDELAAMVNDLAPYWNLSGATATAEFWLSQIIDQLGSDDDRCALPLASRALVRSNIGRYAESIADLQRAIQIGEASGDNRAVGRARWVAADLAVGRELEVWQPLSDAAVASLTASGDEFARAYALVWRAIPHLVRGRLDDGVAALDEARPPVARLDNPSVNASLAAWDAWASFHGGDLARCERLASGALTSPGFKLATQVAFLEALVSDCALLRRGEPLDRIEARRRIDGWTRQGEALAASFFEQWYLGTLAESAPHIAGDDAEQFLDRGPPLHPVGAVTAAIAAGWVAVHRSDIGGAARFLEQARAPRTIAAWPVHRWRVLVLSAVIAARRGHDTEAMGAIDESITLTRRYGLRLGLERTLTAAVVVAHHAGRPDVVRRFVAQRDELRTALGLRDRFAPLAEPLASAVAAAT